MVVYRKRQYIVIEWCYCLFPPAPKITDPLQLMFFQQRDVSVWTASSSVPIEAEFSHATQNSYLLLESCE